MPTSEFFSPDAQKVIAQQGPPAYTGVGQHTSTQAIPIPIVWGSRRLSPNLIWCAGVLPNQYDAFDTGDGLAIPIDGPYRGTVAGHPPLPSGYQTGSDSSLPDHWGFWFNDGTPGGHAVVGTLWGTIVVDGAAPTGLGLVVNKVYGDTDPAKRHFFVPTILGLCEGPVDTLGRIWNGGASAALGTAGPPVGPDLFDTSLAPPILFYQLVSGTSAQNAWAWFQAASDNGGTGFLAQSLAYRLTALVTSPVMDWGTSGHLPQQSFEVVRTPDPTAAKTDSYNLSPDYAPDAFLVDFLISVQYGMGLTLSDIDAASLANFKSYVRSQGIYLSPLLDAQTAATDIIDRWAQLTNTWVYWDGSVMRFVPLGDESLTGNGQAYTPDTTAAYDLGLGDFLGDGLQVDRADPIDCNNRVRLEIADRGADYAKNPIEWKSEVLINQFGLRDASSIDADDICDPVVAAIVADLVGKRMAYLRVLYTFSLASSRYILVLPGTVVTLTDANLGLDHAPARIRSVQEDANGALSIVAEEYPGTLGIARPQTVQLWSQTGGVSGGTTGGGAGAPTTGGPGSSSGGTGTVPEPGTSPSVTWFLVVAGDVWALPLKPVVGWTYEFTHDLQRVPQPTPALLEDNPVTFAHPGGATYQFEDPQDRAAPYATSATWRVSGGTIGWRFDGSNFRCVN